MQPFLCLLTDTGIWFFHSCICFGGNTDGGLNGCRLLLEPFSRRGGLSQQAISPRKTPITNLNPPPQARCISIDTSCGASLLERARTPRITARDMCPSLCSCAERAWSRTTARTRLSFGCYNLLSCVQPFLAEIACRTRGYRRCYEGGSLCQSRLQ